MVNTLIDGENFRMIKLQKINDVSFINNHKLLCKSDHMLHIKLPVIDHRHILGALTNFIPIIKTYPFSLELHNKLLQRTFGTVVSMEDMRQYALAYSLTKLQRKSKLLTSNHFLSESLEM
jgi:hypothetical protein